MLTWKDIKQAVETGHPLHKVGDKDQLTYLMVHLDDIAFGVVGQDGFASAQHFVRENLTGDKKAVLANPPAPESGLLRNQV